MIEDVNRLCHVTQENEAAVQPRQDQPQPNSTPRWSNGQCVLAIPSTSMLNPSFDLSLCQTLLEKDGFQIPTSDFLDPLRTALDPPSVRRYIVFNSYLFHFIMAPVLYMVMWCAVFSTLHIYMTFSDYLVLCLCISLISIFLTTGIVFLLHRDNKEINLNVDVRLVQVNERMAKHQLMVGVADWVQNCSGALQLFFVYWDMTSCLKTLTETLEKPSIANMLQRRLNKRLSHLVLLSEVKVDPPDDKDLWIMSLEHVSEEEQPLLLSTTSSQREDAKLTSNHSLVPHPGLPAQAKAYQLLLTYSAVYVKLLMSKRLSGPPHHLLRARQNHCSNGPLCLCQYIKSKVL